MQLRTNVYSQVDPRDKQKPPRPIFLADNHYFLNRRFLYGLTKVLRIFRTFKKRKKNDNPTSFALINKNLLRVFVLHCRLKSHLASLDRRLTIDNIHLHVFCIENGRTKIFLSNLT